MAKQTRAIKGINVNGLQGRGATFEHLESYDDSLLPEAEELEKLKLVDPNIIEWIKTRTEKEQDARLDFNSRKMKILEGSTRKTFQIDIITLLFAFLIIICGMGLSAFLIHENQTITGTIFGGATIIIAANAFLNFRKKNTSNSKK